MPHWGGQRRYSDKPLPLSIFPSLRKGKMESPQAVLLATNNKNTLKSVGVGCGGALELNKKTTLSNNLSTFPFPGQGK